jgi:acid phosphatase
MPHPHHVVVVVMENRSYADVIGRPQAPYINSLARQGALFTRSYAVTHPSEPNYLALFSGSTQGLANDSCPHTYSGENLGHALLQRRRSFVGYSEGLPSTGALACAHGAYARKHNPWVNFSSVPKAANQPLTAFPTGFGRLPRLSFVVPNLNHDMHDGTVAAGDRWLNIHLGRYASWAHTHNSLLVLTWDEDDRSQGNHIATIVLGAHVRPGLYSERVDHYRVLRMLTDLEGVPPVGRGRAARPVTSVWTR